MIQHFDQGYVKMIFPDRRIFEIGDKSKGPVVKLKIWDANFFKYCVLYGDIGMAMALKKHFCSASSTISLIEWFAANTTNQDSSVSKVKQHAINLIRLIRKMTLARFKDRELKMVINSKEINPAFLNFLPEPN
ncbi:hypothetical protein [Marinoscillum sp. MHG1-6]|uniref:hypothetical protein n=1 Tax=Marinoscillum sp. MHG1-6 TaxID=2959627 RepID=UPI002158701F|nr:hypothetical protein [Marinoscillum sp. MHG1-6]